MASLSGQVNSTQTLPEAPASCTQAFSLCLAHPVPPLPALHSPIPCTCPCSQVEGPQPPGPLAPRPPTIPVALKYEDIYCVL